MVGNTENIEDYLEVDGTPSSSALTSSASSFPEPPLLASATLNKFIPIYHGMRTLLEKGLEYLAQPTGEQAQAISHQFLVVGTLLTTIPTHEEKVEEFRRFSSRLPELYVEYLKKFEEPVTQADYADYLSAAAKLLPFLKEHYTNPHSPEFKLMSRLESYTHTLAAVIRECSSDLQLEYDHTNEDNCISAMEDVLITATINYLREKPGTSLRSYTFEEDGEERDVYEDNSKSLLLLLDATLSFVDTQLQGSGILSALETKFTHGKERGLDGDSLLELSDPTRELTYGLYVIANDLSEKQGLPHYQLLETTRPQLHRLLTTLQSTARFISDVVRIYVEDSTIYPNTDSYKRSAQRDSEQPPVQRMWN